MIINLINSSTVDADVELESDELDPETPTAKPVEHTTIFQLNVGGEFIATTRQTLMKISESTLSDSLQWSMGGQIVKRSK